MPARRPVRPKDRRSGNERRKGLPWGRRIEQVPPKITPFVDPITGKLTNMPTYTRRAGRVLRDFQLYKSRLVGSAVKVSGTSSTFTDTVVQAA